MNIALVAGSFHTDATYHAVFGGLKAALCEQGHRVVIVSRSLRDLPGLRHPDAPGEAIRRIGSLFIPLQLLSILRRDRIDVLHLHFAGRFRAWMLWLLPFAVFHPVRFVTTFQDYDHPEIPRNTLWRRAALRLLLRRSNAVSAVSRSLKNRVEAALPGIAGGVRTVYNGVPPRAHTARAASGRRPYILSIGRLSPYKGMDLLLMAFAALERRDIDLVLCGAPFHEKPIRALIDRLGLRKRVRLTGLKSPREVRELQNGCLFYAAAPRAETFGMAIMETLAAGKAVLSVRTGAIPEYLHDGDNGLLVAPKDVGALTRGMRRLAGNANLRRRLGDRGRETSRRFHWDKIAKVYLRLYGAD